MSMSESAASPLPAAGAPAPSNKHALTGVEKQRVQLEKLLKDPTKLVVLPSPPKEKSIRPPREMMKNVQGSSAGAGSGEFHVYKANRRREYERLKLMDEQAQKEVEAAEFEQRKRKREDDAEAKTAKNRAKRQKRKGAAKKAKGKPKPGIGGKDADAQAQEEDGGESSEDEKPDAERPFKKRRLLGTATLGVEEEIEVQQPAPTLETDLKPVVTVVNAQVLIHDED